MQFMSQSTGWADNIILAMAPLGILTIIVAAIRVGGPYWLRSIIRRARKNRAIPEAELMLLTLNEVCELWNGQEIVRAMGQGPIREFIILLPEGEEADGMVKVEALSLEEGKAKGYMKEYGKADHSRVSHTACSNTSSFIRCHPSRTCHGENHYPR